MAWYNKYRPKTFDDVVGQELVKKVLQNALKKNKIKHAYLFSGPKGTGKTTLARIFAGSLNSLETNPDAKIDIIEMDAASHTGIDDIRQLKESANIPPVYANYKVYIIDEVHMLSKSAMNALLKVLEEPPKYLVFLLATTNPEKLLPTVLSRLTKLTLINHSIEGLLSRLKYIADKENLEMSDNAMTLIAKRGVGSQRDSINFLETVASYELGSYDSSSVAELLGMLPTELLSQTAEWLMAVYNDSGSDKVFLELLPKLESCGIDGESFLAQLLEFLLDTSLNGNRGFDGIIVPIAEILDLKLPLTEVVSVMILVRSKLSTVSQHKKKGLQAGNNIELVKKPSVTSKQQFEKKPLSEKIKLQDSDLVSKDLNEEKVAKQEQKIVKTEKIVDLKDVPADLEGQKDNKKEQIATVLKHVEPKQSTLKISAEDMKSFILDLQKENDCPTQFKMIKLSEVGFDSDSNELNMTPSVPLFQTALRSSKLVEWISQKVKDKFSIDIEVVGAKKAILDKKISIENVVKKVDKKNESQQRKNLDFDSFISQSKQSDSTVVKDYNNVAEPVPQKQKDLVEGEIFYSMYKTLPENMDGKGVKIRKAVVQKPIKEDLEDVVEQDDNFDNVAEEMFDFE